MDDNQLRRDWNAQCALDNQSGSGSGIKEIVGTGLIILGVAFGIWILMVIRDLINGNDIGLMKELSKEVLVFKNKDISLTFPTRSVALVIAGGLLFVASLISMGFIAQGVILIHADFQRMLRKIDSVKMQIAENFRKKQN